jgi:tRNA nucleotidyltransferase (CCA-adding enzyme)
MTRIVKSGEVNGLVPHRVWKETEAALAGSRPRVFFEVLRECGALGVVFTEVEALFGVPQPEKWHPEVDCGVHAMMVVDQAAKLCPDVEVRFAALVHDLGKAATPARHLPQHPGHEKRSVRLIAAMANRLPLPKACLELALLVAEFHAHGHRAFELRAATMLKLLERADAFRRPDRFRKFLLACEADSRGRTGFEERPYPQAEYLQGALRAATRVSAKEFVREGLDGAQIGEALRRKRLQAIGAYKADVAPPRT